MNRYKNNLFRACYNCSAGVLSDCRKPQCLPADGFEKGLISFNRQIPGPLIKVCKNDAVVVDLKNGMHSETFSIHWHGILQRDTPYMDGVPFVTQFPILPSDVFEYAFFVPEPGTFFYHSHSGLQRYNGAYGGLIVREPLHHDTNSHLYDCDLLEHTLVLSDCSHESVEMFFIGLPTRQPGLLPQCVLINGKGRYFYVSIVSTHSN
jgi:L-ascorbate oxidase